MRRHSARKLTANSLGMVSIIVVILAIAGIVVAMATQSLSWLYVTGVILLFGLLFKGVAYAADKSQELANKKKHL